MLSLTVKSLMNLDMYGCVCVYIYVHIYNACISFIEI